MQSTHVSVQANGRVTNVRTPNETRFRYGPHQLTETFHREIDMSELQ